jgi:ABC-2 type transport system ATP-binding protein
MSAAAARERSRELLARFGLDPDSATLAGKLSGGMRRKLDVAIGLVHAPSVLFLDEPTTGLDPQARAAMWALVRQLTSGGAMTVMLTTHYLDEADELADRVGIIDLGRKVIEGTPAELKATLAGDSVTVELVEPDAERVRAVAAAVPGLRGIIVETHGTQGVLIARCDDAGAAVGPVIAALETARIGFGSVSASRPSLDDVYLHYAGRTYASAQAGGRAAVPANTTPDSTGTQNVSVTQNGANR